MHVTTQRVGLTAAASALLAAACLAAPGAHAAPAQEPTASLSTAFEIQKALGEDRSAGAYLDRGTGRTVVTVTDDAAAGAVRAAGAVPRRVARSGAELKAVMSTLDRNAGLAGSAWGVDPSTNQIVVYVPKTFTAAERATMTTAAAGLGGAARIEYVPQEARPDLAGGHAIYSDRATRCSVAFNAQAAGRSYVLTAGHCTRNTSTWYQNSSHATVLGPTARSDFPTNDFGAVQYADGHPDPALDVYLYNGTYRNMTSAANPVVGQAHQRAGSTTGLRSGTITAVNVTVNYADGPVHGLAASNTCADPGDSGGAYFAGTVALGIHSGGSGTCASPGTEYFQPVVEALTHYGLSLR